GSSVTPVFEAVACFNPYPADWFDEVAFNLMVVKCVFSGVPIGAIVGLDARRNDNLVRMLRDPVCERHAAGRPVPDAAHRWIAGPAADERDEVREVGLRMGHRSHSRGVTDEAREDSPRPGKALPTHRMSFRRSRCLIPASGD